MRRPRRVEKMPRREGDFLVLQSSSGQHLLVHIPQITVILPDSQGRVGVETARGTITVRYSLDTLLELLGPAAPAGTPTAEDLDDLWANGLHAGLALAALFCFSREQDEAGRHLLGDLDVERLDLDQAMQLLTGIPEHLTEDLARVRQYVQRLQSQQKQQGGA